MRSIAELVENDRNGSGWVERELKNIPKEKVRQIALENIEAIKNSSRRDFRF